MLIRGLTHRFGRLEVLTGLDLEVGPHETIALVGPSGCGKSTLLELIGGLTPVQSGTIAVGVERTDGGRARECTWMAQTDLLLPWKRAVDNAALAPVLAGRDRGSARRAAGEILDHLGLADFADAYPHELSGGMRQRVAVARTLLAGTPVLLLDEPFAALDAITRGELQSWLIDTLRAERRTTILVTHDVEEALYVADRVLLLSPRPGSITLTLDSPAASERDIPRAEAISRPGFVAARARALEALSAGPAG